MKTKVPKLLSRFAFEFITILTAVLLSFAINEWRVKHENRALAIDLLEQIRSNVQLDTMSLHRNTGMIGVWINSYNELLAIESIESIDTTKFTSQLDQLISYTKFQPTSTGYEEMKQTSGSYLIQNKDLLKQIIQLYTYSYGYPEEWHKIDSDHVLERIIPFVDSHFPHSTWSNMHQLVEHRPEDLLKVLKSDHFKNLIRTSIMFKETVNVVYTRSLVAADSVLWNLDREINDLKGN